MIWTKVSDYCIKCGDWTIAKYNLKIGVKYGLYHLNESKGFFATADEAKASIEELK